MFYEGAMCQQDYIQDRHSLLELFIKLVSMDSHSKFGYLHDSCVRASDTASGDLADSDYREFFSSLITKIH